MESREVGPAMLVVCMSWRHAEARSRNEAATSRRGRLTSRFSTWPSPTDWARNSSVDIAIDVQPESRTAATAILVSAIAIAHPLGTAADDANTRCPAALYSLSG